MRKLGWALLVVVVVVSGCGSSKPRTATFGTRSSVVAAMTRADSQISFDAGAAWNQPASATSYWGNDSAEGFAVGLYGPTTSDVTEILLATTGGATLTSGGGAIANLVNLFGGPAAATYASNALKTRGLSNKDIFGLGVTVQVNESNGGYTIDMAQSNGQQQLQVPSSL